MWFVIVVAVVAVGYFAWRFSQSRGEQAREETGNSGDDSRSSSHVTDVASRVGFVRGSHYTDYVEAVKELKRQGRHGELETLLLELIDAVEAEARGKSWGVAPWYYEEAAKLYRKQKDFLREIEILERYSRNQQGRGSVKAVLAERLEKARLLLDKQREGADKRN